MADELKLGEVIIDAVIAKLKTGMAARIATINAEKGDFTTSAPGTNDYYVFGVTQLARAPAIIVTIRPGETDIRGEGPRGFILQQEIGIFIVEEDSDRQVVGRKMLRQERAVTETLLYDAPGKSLTGSAFNLAYRGNVPGPVLNPENNEAVWRGGHLSIFLALQSEN